MPPSATEPSQRLLHLFGTVCRRQYVHRRHYQFSAEDWRLNFLSGLTAVLPHERLTVLTNTWPHITVTCPCSPRTSCHVKSIHYHHYYHHHPSIHSTFYCWQQQLLVCEFNDEFVFWLADISWSTNDEVPWTSKYRYAVLTCWEINFTELFKWWTMLCNLCF